MFDEVLRKNFVPGDTNLVGISDPEFLIHFFVYFLATLLKIMMKKLEKANLKSVNTLKQFTDVGIKKTWRIYLKVTPDDNSLPKKFSMS